MKKSFLFIAACLLSLAAFAQQLNYQVVVRNNNQQLVTNTNVIANVVVKVSGTQVYTEAVNGTTNLHGLLDFFFGDDTFTSIDWANATISVQVSDASTNVVYVPAQDRNVNAVPYALTAANAGVGIPQTLSIEGNTITISGGNSVTIPAVPTTTGELTNNSSFVDNASCSTVSFCDIVSTISDMQNTITNLQNENSLLRNTISDLQSRIDLLFPSTPITPVEVQPCPGAATVTDIDGNTYNTIQVGNQCWMKENLRTTRYSDGTTIAKGTATGSNTAYYYIPEHTTPTLTNYGLLYNWKAVMHNSSSSNTNPSGVQGICPTGWHVPSSAEWTQLKNYVESQSEYKCDGNSSNIAKALASNMGWHSCISACSVGYMPAQNNASGFNVVPTGHYCESGYVGLGDNAHYWSVTQVSNDSSRVYTEHLYYDFADVKRYNSTKGLGYSVRCLRD